MLKKFGCRKSQTIPEKQWSWKRLCNEVETVIRHKYLGDWVRAGERYEAAVNAKQDVGEG